MNLTEFLETANVDDELAVAEAQAHPVNTYRKIGANEARQFFSITGALDSIEAGVTDTTPATLMAGLPTTVGMLCKAVLGTLNSSGNKFATDPNFQDGQLNRAASSILVGAGIYPQAVDTAFFASAEDTTYPFANTTLSDVKAVRYPAVWTPCAHVGQDWLVSVSNGDSYNFVADLVEFDAPVKLRCTWATSVGSTEVLSTREAAMQGSTKLVSQLFSKQSLQLPNDARILKFEYLAAYDGAVSSVSVSK